MTKLTYKILPNIVLLMLVLEITISKAQSHVCTRDVSVQYNTNSNNSDKNAVKLLFEVDKIYLTEAQFDSCKLTEKDIVKQEMVGGKCLITTTNLPIVISGNGINLKDTTEIYLTKLDKMSLSVIGLNRVVNIERRFDTLVDSKYKNGYLLVTLNEPEPRPKTNIIRIIAQPIEVIKIVDYLHLNEKHWHDLNLIPLDLQESIDIRDSMKCFGRFLICKTKLLVVVNNTIYDEKTKPLLSTISADSIKSIKKIDGLTATELYGEKGENGAIVVTLQQD